MQCLCSPEEGIGLTGICEQSGVRVCDPALCLLEEQCVLLPAESSLQNLYVLHLQNSSGFKHYGEREETGLFFKY